METLTITKPDHDCTASTEGEWVVFRCPRCPEYERRIHIQTGDTVVRGLNQWRHGGVSGNTVQ
jgi:hypothetical protein